MNKNKLTAMWRRVLRSLTIAMCEFQIRRLEEAAARARRFARDLYLQKNVSHSQRMAALDAWLDAGALSSEADKYRNRLREVIHAAV